MSFKKQAVIYTPYSDGSEVSILAVFLAAVVSEAKVSVTMLTDKKLGNGIHPVWHDRITPYQDLSQDKINDLINQGTTVFWLQDNLSLLKLCRDKKAVNIYLPSINLWHKESLKFATLCDTVWVPTQKLVKELPIIYNDVPIKHMPVDIGLPAETERVREQSLNVLIPLLSAESRSCFGKYRLYLEAFYTSRKNVKFFLLSNEEVDDAGLPNIVRYPADNYNCIAGLFKHCDVVFDVNQTARSALSYMLSACYYRPIIAVESAATAENICDGLTGCVISGHNDYGSRLKDTAKIGAFLESSKLRRCSDVLQRSHEIHRRNFLLAIDQLFYRRKV